MIRKPQLGSRLSNESWYVNEAFFENAISNIWKHSKKTEHSKHVYKIAINQKGLALYKYKWKEFLAFYEAAKRTQKYQKEVGGKCFKGNPEFFERYLLSFDQLVFMLEEFIKEKDNESANLHHK